MGQGQYWFEECCQISSLVKQVEQLQIPLDVEHDHLKTTAKAAC